MISAIPVLVKACRPLEDGTFLLAVDLPTQRTLILLHMKVTALDFDYSKLRSLRRDGSWDVESIIGGKAETKTLRLHAVSYDENLALTDLDEAIKKFHFGTTPAVLLLPNI